MGDCSHTNPPPWWLLHFFTPEDSCQRHPLGLLPILRTAHCTFECSFFPTYLRIAAPWQSLLCLAFQLLEKRLVNDDVTYLWCWLAFLRIGPVMGIVLRNLDFHLPLTESTRQIVVKSLFNECLVSGQGSKLESWLVLSWSLSYKGQKELISSHFYNNEPLAILLPHWNTRDYLIFVVTESKAECREEPRIIHRHSQQTGANCLFCFLVLFILSSCLSQPAHCSTLEQWIICTKAHIRPTGLFCLNLFLTYWLESNEWSAKQVVCVHVCEKMWTEVLCRVGCSLISSSVSSLGQIFQACVLICMI